MPAVVTRLLASLLVLGAAASAEPAVANGECIVRIVTAPPGLAVSVDGKLVGLSPREEALPPGVHTVTAERAGVVTSQTLSVTAGETRTVTLTLAPLTEPPRAFPLAGVVTFGAGAVALGVGLLLQLPAREAAGTVSGLFARGGGWDAPAAAIEAAGLRAQTWSWVSSAVGAGLMASGVLVTMLQLTAPRAPALVLLPTPQGGVVAWSTSW